MSETVVYTDPSELKNVAEQVDSIESEDYTGYELIPIGDFVSQSRVIKVAKKDRYFSAEISFPNGIQDPETGRSFGGGQYPLRTWATSKKYQQEGKTGETSGMAEYLKRVGFDVKQLRTNEDILDALAESQNLPVKVHITWTNQTEKTGEFTPEGKPIYTKEFARAADFNIGTKDEPVYQPFFVKDGVKVLAKHKVSGFKKVS